MLAAQFPTGLIRPAAASFLLSQAATGPDAGGSADAGMRPRSTPLPAAVPIPRSKLLLQCRLPREAFSADLIGVGFATRFPSHTNSCPDRNSGSAHLRA